MSELPDLPPSESERLGPFVRVLEFNAEIGKDTGWVDEWLKQKGLDSTDFFDAVLDITSSALERYDEGADLRGAVGAAIAQAICVGFGAAEGRDLLS